MTEDASFLARRSLRLDVVSAQSQWFMVRWETTSQFRPWRRWHCRWPLFPQWYSATHRTTRQCMAARCPSNGFELAYLTGLVVNDVEGVITAARTLLTGRTQWVAVTSAAPETWALGEIQVVLVPRTQAEVIAHPHHTQRHRRFILRHLGRTLDQQGWAVTSHRPYVPPGCARAVPYRAGAMHRTVAATDAEQPRQLRSTGA